MTANALNIAAPNAAALMAGGAKGRASALGNLAPGGKADGPLAGFEALLATLFPQAAPTTTTAAAAATASPQASGSGGLATSAEQLGPGAAAGDEDKAPAEAELAAWTTVASPDAALAVCLIAIPVPAPEVTLKTPQGESVQSSPPTGQLRALIPFGIGQALVTGPGKTELAPEADQAVEPGLEHAPPGLATIAAADAAAAKAPPHRPIDAGFAPPPAVETQVAAKAAPQRPIAAGFAPPPAVEAQVAAKAAIAEGHVTDAPPPQSIVPQTETPPPVIAASLPPPPRDAAPQATTPASRTQKAERGKAGTETAALDDATAPTGVAKPATARAAITTAKPASPDADADAAGGEAAPARIEPDQRDPAFSLETRATTTSLTPAAHIAHAVRGAPETVANLAAQILKKLEGQSTRFDLELDPAGLGKVNVRLEIGAQGALTAAMSFDNPQAAAELRGRAAELQKALEQAGFNLAGGLTFDVASDRGQQQQPGQPWQDQGEAAGRAFRRQAFDAALDTAGDANETATNGALRLRRGVTAGLDVRI